ncbi:hypothetical protein BDN71DRAFT_1454791, partial [Pleurotus eryngii]
YVPASLTGQLDREVESTRDVAAKPRDKSSQRCDATMDPRLRTPESSPACKERSETDTNSPTKVDSLRLSSSPTPDHRHEVLGLYELVSALES